MTSRLRWVWLLPLVGSVLTACGVSPQPEPPGPVEVPTIDLGRLSFTPALPYSLLGEAGAVTPGSSTLEITALTLADPTDSLITADDGSFEAALAGTLVDEYRLVAEREGARSEPLDIVGAPNAFAQPQVAAAPRPLEDCLLLSPALELDVGAVAVGSSAAGEVILSNGCGADVTVGALPLRLGVSGFSVEAVTPFVIPDGQTRSFEVVLTPTLPGLAEDIVFVEITSPEVGQRPIGVRGTGE